MTYWFFHPLTGSFVIPVKNSTDVFQIVNPNNWDDRILLDFSHSKSMVNKTVMQCIVVNDAIYALAQDVKDGTIQLVRFKQNGVQILPIQFEFYQTPHIVEVGENLVVATGKYIYIISRENSVRRIYNNKRIFDTIIPYKDGIISINEHNKIVFVNQQGINEFGYLPDRYSFQGWWKYGEQILVTDRYSHTSYSVNLQNGYIRKIGSLPRRYLGIEENGSHILLLLMSKSGNQDISDFEAHLIDLLRNEHDTVCNIPYIYSPWTQGIRHISPEIGEFVYWQYNDFEKIKFARINEYIR